MSAQSWEELRNSNGILYKLTAKSSDAKEVNITTVPKTKLIYMHLNDNSKAYKNGSFDKSLSKSVSLSMPEVMILRTLMTAMDPKVTELSNTCSQALGKKRKAAAEDSEAMLTEFNAYQGQPQQGQYANEYYFVPQYQQAKQQHLQQPMTNNPPCYSIPQYQQAPPAYPQAPGSGPQVVAGCQQPTMNYGIEAPNFYDSVI